MSWTHKAQKKLDLETKKQELEMELKRQECRSRILEQLEKDKRFEPIRQKISNKLDNDT